MIVIDTIGALIDHKCSLSVHCNARDCWNRKELDLHLLAQRLGRNHGSMAADLKPYFRCSRCGSKDVGFTLGANVNSADALSSPPVGVVATSSAVDDATSSSHRTRRRRSRR